MVMSGSVQVDWHCVRFKLFAYSGALVDTKQYSYKPVCPVYFCAHKVQDSVDGCYETISSIVSSFYIAFSVLAGEQYVIIQEQFNLGKNQEQDAWHISQVGDHNMALPFHSHDTTNSRQLPADRCQQHDRRPSTLPAHFNVDATTRASAAIKPNYGIDTSPTGEAYWLDERR